VITATDVAYVRRLVRRETGVVLGEEKDYLVRSLLERIARGAKDEFSERLVRDGALRRVVVERLLNNETSFHREPAAFEALRDVWPRLEGPARIWSAACSTGQEAFSLAMEMLEHAPALAKEATILGTDLSERALAQARAGTYTCYEVNRGLPARLLVRHFEEDAGGWRVAPAVRRLVEFRLRDLTAPWPARASFDVIFLRNVLIYFDDATRRRVLRDAERALRPGGWLFLGAAEACLRVGKGLVPAGHPGVPSYRRTGGEA